jgi:hypothetical protein
MTYEFHNDTLVILFFMLLMSGILCFIQMLPTPSEVRGLQNADHLNIKYVSTQNANVNNNNAKPATPDITRNGNVIEKASDKGLYRVQLRLTNLLAFFQRKGLICKSFF